MAKKKKPRRKSPAPSMAELMSIQDDLREKLRDCLTQAELAELYRQIRNTVTIAVEKATEEAVKESCLRLMACTLRVLHDRYRFGKRRSKEMFDAVLDYIRDLNGGRITLKEMLDTLEFEDQMRLLWEKGDGGQDDG